jgi:hypothetical protein
MSDLTTLMFRATATVDATPASVLDDDVSRGQRARRRRTRLVGTGVAGVFAATVAVGVPLTSTAPASAAELVAYTAEQPAGFTIAEVPEGWHVLSSDRSSLMLADGDDDGSDPNNLEGRIVASLVGSESLPGGDLEAQTFAVGGQEVLVYELLAVDGEPGGTLGVFAPEGDGDYLSVQLPPELHWKGEVAARFVEGLDVTDDAGHTVG